MEMRLKIYGLQPGILKIVKNGWIMQNTNGVLLKYIEKIKRISKNYCKE